MEPMDIAGLPDTAVAARVHGSTPFVLLNVWAQRMPTYESFVVAAVSICQQSMRENERLVVVGDFNSPAQLPKSQTAHINLLAKLTDDFGLVSAYHVHHSVDSGNEAHPTHYWRWNRAAPFHIDFCFIPGEWCSRLGGVEVGSFDEWPDSDHRPIVVEIEC